MTLSAKKVFSTIGFALFAMLLVTNLVRIGTVLLFRYFSPQILLTNWYTWFLTGFSFYLCGGLTFYLIISKIKPAPINEARAFPIKHLLISLIISIGTMYVLNLFSAYLNNLISFLKGSVVTNPLETATANSSWLLTLLFGCVFSPLVEEIIFRGVLLNRLRWFGDKNAILFSGLMFGLFHVNLYQFFYATALGFIFAYVATKTNSIIYSFILHAIINLLGMFIMPILVSMNAAIGGFIIIVCIIGAIVAFFTYKSQIVIEPPIAELPEDFKPSCQYANVGTICYFVLCGIIILINILV